MKELQYPFDADYILSRKKQIKRELLAQDCDFLEKRIAILGGSTTNDIKHILELFLLNYGIKPTFYESEYNQYYEDSVFPNARLKEFCPDVIYIHTTNRNITNYPTLQDDSDTVTTLLNDEMEKFKTIWNTLSAEYGCPIIQNNFELPFYRLMGNREASDFHGKVNFITRLNLLFYEYAQTHNNFYICDINYISADYGLARWSDPFYYYMYKYALNVKAIPYLSFNIANIIKSLFGKNKKGMVLDLDNTLWGGVIGDDGVDNITLGPEEAEGQVFSEFQHYLKEHLQLGVLLNIDSKNELENALAGLNHSCGELRKDDFIVIKANWESKDKNLLAIAKELNVLPESLVFVDDNPAERHIVATQIPGVCTPELTDPHEYIRVLDRSGFFEVTTLSKDDAGRTKMYRENLARAEFQSKFADYEEYLQSLGMQAAIRAFEPSYYSRIAQLTNKSNQFNLTTHRYTQSEIESIAEDGKHITLYGKLQDRFGDNGVVSVIIGNIRQEICEIDLWLMSCRVLKRNMEFAMMDQLILQCQSNHIKCLKGFYYPTAKNKMVSDFYATVGFHMVKEDQDGNSEWEFLIPEHYIKQNRVISIMEDDFNGEN